MKKNNNKNFINNPYEFNDDFNFENIENIDNLGNLEKDNNKNNKNNNKLPNVWTLVEKFEEDFPLLKFCNESSNFYIYKEDKNLWVTISNKEVGAMFISWLKIKYPNCWKQFSPNKISEVILVLGHKIFSLNEARKNANSNGILIPFLNGVLNSKTREFMAHDSKNYNTYVIPLNYEVNKEIKNTLMSDFLSECVNYNSHALNILRACLYLALTNNLSKHIALFIYGPGGTGKSTLINIILFLLGKDASVSGSLQLLKSQFGKHSLINKILLVINELPQIFLGESSFLKSLIGLDPMIIDRKFKDTVNWIPSVFLIITSNTLWTVKNMTTGYGRRFIYMPFYKVPKVKDTNLFNIDSNNIANGKLVEFLPGLINWILSCPQEYINLLDLGGEVVSKIIDNDVDYYVNPLRTWAETTLAKSEDPNKLIELAAKSDKAYDINTLYGNYIKWCERNNLQTTIIAPNKFSAALYNLLLSFNWDVSRVRKTNGVWFSGLGFRFVTTPEHLIAKDTSAIMNDYLKFHNTFQEEKQDLNFEIKNINFDYSLLEN
jgi:P4 family phage/plasmid primase-like protien